jgi:hypothetical protein
MKSAYLKEIFETVLCIFSILDIVVLWMECWVHEAPSYKYLNIATCGI